jgi:hypothetical protein
MSNNDFIFLASLLSKNVKIFLFKKCYLYPCPRPFLRQCLSFSNQPLAALLLAFVDNTGIYMSSIFGLCEVTFLAKLHTYVDY